MFANTYIRAGLALAALLFIAAQPVRAQEPSASSVALAKEFVVIKGASNAFEPLIPGVIETAKNMFAQTHPMLGKELSDVAAQMRKDLAPRREELINEIAKLYAAKFSEQELKDMIAFYKSPLGKKLLTDEPGVIDQSMSRAQNFANRFSEEVISKMRGEMKKKGHDL